VPESIRGRISTLPRLYRDKRISAEAQRIFSRIEEEHQRGDEYSKDAIKCYTGELFFLFLRSEETPFDTAERKSIAQRAAKYARENYCSQIGLTDTAERLSVTAEHLSRSFKREIGFGFSEYILMLRLQKAEYMLKNEPGRAISEIAFACGFNDSNYFSDKFKRAYGIPPSHLKRK
jgi:AraC-like DNA-binding protein